jgi:general control protein GCN4
MAGMWPRVSCSSRGGLTVRAGNDNAFDLNMGAGLGPVYGLCQDAPIDYAATAFTSVNNPVATPASTPRTVSPRDIFADPHSATPPSGAFTNLTSPNLNSPFVGSPFVTDTAYTHSPLLADPVEEWFPLFPDSADSSNAVSVSNTVVQPANFDLTMAASTVTGHHDNAVTDTDAKSQAEGSPSPGQSSPVILDGARRRRSSAGASPGRVTKPRRRKGPLPPIAVDPSDKLAMKRARNTLAARDSRQRKFDHILKLETENAQLKDSVTDLEAQLEKWKGIALGLGFNGSG